MYALALTFDSFNLQCCSVARMFSSSAGWLVLVVLAEFLETSALETKFPTVCASPGTVCASWAGQPVQSKLLVLLTMFSLGLTRWGSPAAHNQIYSEVFLLPCKWHMECRSWFHRGEKMGPKSRWNSEGPLVLEVCRSDLSLHAYHGSAALMHTKCEEIGVYHWKPQPCAVHAQHTPWPQGKSVMHKECGFAAKCCKMQRWQLCSTEHSLGRCRDIFCMVLVSSFWAKT